MCFECVRVQHNRNVHIANSTLLINNHNNKQNRNNKTLSSNHANRKYNGTAFCGSERLSTGDGRHVATFRGSNFAVDSPNIKLIWHRGRAIAQKTVNLEFNAFRLSPLVYGAYDRWWTPRMKQINFIVCVSLSCLFRSEKARASSGLFSIMISWICTFFFALFLFWYLSKIF